MRKQICRERDKERKREMERGETEIEREEKSYKLASSIHRFERYGFSTLFHSLSLND
jgi:repressor of nif and glnA expression